MSASDEILAIVPYLRRHARMLCGSQATGDEYVRLCLEMVMAEPHWLRGTDVKVQLFHAFHVVWRSTEESFARGLSLSRIELKDRVEIGLAGLPTVERQVLLLVAVEGFSIELAAEILGLDVAQARRQLGNARDHLHSETSVRTLIIEDEPVIALDVAQIVREMGHEVVGMASREDQSIALAETLEPALVLADIQLEDVGDGIAAAERILSAYQVPIIFVTGYPERLLTGRGHEPAFVISKPFSAETLKATIAHALTLYASPNTAARHQEELLAKLREITARNYLPH